jgi:hypothetical protein
MSLPEKGTILKINKETKHSWRNTGQSFGVLENRKKKKRKEKKRKEKKRKEKKRKEKKRKMKSKAKSKSSQA